jgi:hypothetical protein
MIGVMRQLQSAEKSFLRRRLAAQRDGESAEECFAGNLWVQIGFAIAEFSTTCPFISFHNNP